MRWRAPAAATAFAVGLATWGNNFYEKLPDPPTGRNEDIYSKFDALMTQLRAAGTVPNRGKVGYRNDAVGTHPKPHQLLISELAYILAQHGLAPAIIDRTGNYPTVVVITSGGRLAVERSAAGATR